MKYKSGQKVKIVKPSRVVYGVQYTDDTTNVQLTWSRGMDQYHGTVVTLDEFDRKVGWSIVETGIGYQYLECWLEPISTNDPNAAYDRAMGIV